MQSAQFAIAVFEFVLLIFSLSFHECSHAWMASRLGDQTARLQGRVTLNPIYHIDVVGSLILPAIIIFGPSKLPEIGRSLGKSMREFKDSVSGVTEVQDTLQAVGEVRSAMSPTNLAGAFIPGVKDVQETVSAAKDVTAPAAVPAERAEGVAGTTPPTS